MSLRKSLRRLLTRRSIDPGPLALLWWGSFERGGGATLGDLKAVEHLSAQLKARGLAPLIVSHPDLGLDGHLAVPNLGMLKQNIKTLVFVCGPLVDGSALRRLLADHPAARKAAAGVSIIGASRAIAAEFDAIVARDGLPETYFDLAVSEVHSPEAPSGRRITAGICYRGKQNEYGRENAKSEQAEQLLNQIAGEFGLEPEVIDTVMRDGNDDRQILDQFKRVDIVLTTRMHGSLFALACGKPVIAIDQIAGGAKVKAALTKIGWPAAFSIDDVSIDELRRCCQDFIEHWPLEAIRRSQSAMLDKSTEAMNAAVGAICDLTAQRDVLGSTAGQPREAQR